MKKLILLSGIFIGLSTLTYAQQKLSKKDGQKILETAISCVKKNDTAGFIKLWALDDKQWPYHGGAMFTRQEILNNFAAFKLFFDEPIAKNLKFESVICDTVAMGDPHRDFSKYYIRGTYKLSNNTKKGVGFFMDYVGDKWLVRFSPDYSNE